MIFQVENPLILESKMLSKIYLLILFTILKDVSCLSWHDYHQNSEDSSNRKNVHTVPLGSGATFHWRYIFIILIEFNVNRYTEE